MFVDLFERVRMNPSRKTNIFLPQLCKTNLFRLHSGMQ